MVSRVAAIIGLVLTAPLLGLVALAIRITMGKKVFFAQERSGKGARTFRIIKFRTMRHPVATGEDDGARVTGLGRFLRATSLDELPSLLNVARGEMALVGPRPFIADYAAHFDEHQARRFEVKPGLTGWAQINGRNSLTWAEKFDLDIWYVDHRSPWLDLRILMRTAGVVFRSAGLSHEGHATMPRLDAPEVDGLPESHDPPG